MKTSGRIHMKEIIYAGVFSTIVMDIGYVFLKVTKIVKGSMEPQYLGRWILNMLNGEFIQENIDLAAKMNIEKPVSVIAHYITGIILSGIFLWLKKRIKSIPESIYMGLVFGLITVLLPWTIFYPSIGFGFMGLDTPEGASNISYSIIYHSFYGLGITLWLGFVRRIVIKENYKLQAEL